MKKITQFISINLIQIRSWS